MSRVFYERIPRSYRDVVDHAAGEMIRRERQWYRAEEAAAREALARAGVRFTYPDLAPFRRSARQVYLEWADRVGGLPLIERILSFPHGPQTTNR
jgi:TRAP-type C4-dicarboxylate transport system substrate-binding protein